MTAPPGLVVLEATVADAATLAALHALAFPRPWSAEGLATMLRQPGTLALIGWPQGAVPEEEPAGFILCRAVVDEAEVMTLAVRPERRRRGVAAGLVGAAAARLAAAGATMLHLEVADDNAAALGLYRGCGFRTVGRRAEYYAVTEPGGRRSDAVLMTLDLT